MSEERYFVNGPDRDDIKSDYFGAASAEIRMTGEETGLEGLAGLVDEEAFVVGIDLLFDDDESHDEVILYVLDRKARGLNNYEEVAAYAAREGALPVNSIKLHNANIRAFMSRMRGFAHVHLRFNKAHADVPTYVENYTDFPPDPNGFN